MIRIPNEWIRIRAFFLSVMDPHRFQCGSEPRDSMFNKYTKKSNFLLQKLQFIYIYPWASMKDSKLQEKPLASKENIHHFQIPYEISSLFFYFVGLFALLDPDPHSQYGPGSSRPSSMRIYLDPQHWFFLKPPWLISTSALQTITKPFSCFLEGLILPLGSGSRNPASRSKSVTDRCGSETLMLTTDIIKFGSA